LLLAAGAAVREKIGEKLAVAVVELYYYFRAPTQDREAG
jgi:hypothetical protein